MSNLCIALESLDAEKSREFRSLECPVSTSADTNTIVREPRLVGTIIHNNWLTQLFFKKSSPRSIHRIHLMMPISKTVHLWSLWLKLLITVFPVVLAIRLDSSAIPVGGLNQGKCRMVISELNFFPNGINQFVELTKICDLHIKPTLQYPVHMKFYKLLFLSHDGYLLTSCNLAGEARLHGKGKSIFFTIGDEIMKPDNKISDCHIPNQDIMDGQRLPIGEMAPIGVALIYNPSQAAINGVDLLQDGQGLFTRTKIDSRLQKKIVENLADFQMVTTLSPYTHCEYFETYYKGYNSASKSILRDWAQLDDSTERSLSRCPDESNPVPTAADFHPFQASFFTYAALSRGAPNLCATATPFAIKDYQPPRKVPRYDFQDGFKCLVSTDDPAIDHYNMISSPLTYYQKLQELIKSRVPVPTNMEVDTALSQSSSIVTSNVLGDPEELGKTSMPFEKKKLSEAEFEQNLVDSLPLVWEKCNSFQPKELIKELEDLKNPPIYPDDILDNSTCFWMEWLPTKAMRCKLCNSFLQQGIIKDRPGSPKITKIMTTGHINKGPRAKTLNRGIIRRRLENPLHLQAVEFATLFQSGLRGEELYQQFHAPGGLVRTFTNATVNLLATAYALATVDLPFYRFPKIRELLVYLNASIGHLYGNPTSLKGIQVAISQMMHKDLVKYLKDEKPEFSLLIDSSTDVASLPALAIVIQPFDSNKNVKLYLYKVMWISDRETAQVLWDHFMKQLKTDGLEEFVREKYVGFASDGGANVLAFRRILQTYTDHGEKMIMVHCFAHKSELVIKNAWKDEDFALSVEDTVNVLHRIFGSKSAKKKRHLQLAQEEVGDPAFSIKRIQKTRWVNSRLRALDKIVLHWQTIVKALRRVMEDKTIKDAKQRKIAEDALEKLKEPSFIMTTAFVADMYTAMSGMSLKLQDRGSTLIGKKEKREKLKASLIKMKTENGPFVQSILDQSRFSSPQFRGCEMNIENFEKGYIILGKIALNRPQQPTDGQSLFKQRENYINLIIHQLDQYFPNDATDDLDVLDPSHWPLTNLEGYGNENITAMNRNLKWNYDDDDLLQSWISLKTSVANHADFKQRSSILNPEEFWASYLREDSISWSDGMRYIIKNVITIPASTAEVERVFSYYTQTKTLRRYNLDVDTVDALIRIRFNGPSTLQEFDTFRYVWEFLDGHSRSDDQSVSAHKTQGGGKQQEISAEESTPTHITAEIEGQGNIQTLAETDIEGFWNQPSEPTATSTQEVNGENFAADDDEIDYDLSSIIDAIELQGIEEESA